MTTVQLDDGALLDIWYEDPNGLPAAVLRQACRTLE